MNVPTVRENPEISQGSCAGLATEKESPIVWMRIRADANEASKRLKGCLLVNFNFSGYIVNCAG